MDDIPIYIEVLANFAIKVQQGFSKQGNLKFARRELLQVSNLKCLPLVFFLFT